MRDIFTSTRMFASNSLKDLLDAREEYHYQLMALNNVVATAIGFYRIRKTDPWPTANDDAAPNKHHDDSPRTLANSEVRLYSWPAVLVFVNKWMSKKTLFEVDPQSVVPKLLSLEDGRKVPVCVIEAPVESVTDDAVEESGLVFPTNIISGGFPLLLEVQKEKRIASVGCLVTDGHTTYALTNKHVAGEKGTIISSKFGVNEKPIGISSSLSVGRVPFNEVYENWPGKHVYVNMDVGLVKINDLNEWKTEVYGIGEMGHLADLHTGNFNLNLIGASVVGYGGVSGKISGKIQALFYRYKSEGGYEYLSDFLIGSDDDKAPMILHPGDSGTVLMYEREDFVDGKKVVVELMPIGVLWGHHTVIDGDSRNVRPYALVSCLSLVLNRLGVDLVRGWNVDIPNTWGKVGHYTIGSLAVNEVNDAKLKSWMMLNLENFGFKKDKLTKAIDRKDNPDLDKDPTHGFCPLSDVPDIIWKQFKPYVDKKGEKKGAAWGRKGDENPNHYADADYIVNNKNLYDYCATIDDFTIANWVKYFNDVDKDMGTKVDDKVRAKRGLICFRVWQIFDYLADAAKKGDAERFVFGAGVLAHYVGDACQPLHSSYMSDGDPKDNKKIWYTPPRGGSAHPKGVPYQKNVNPGSGVHVAYEDTMIDDYIDKILPKIEKLLDEPGSAINKEPLPSIGSGKEAGFAILKLMQATQNELVPKDIVEKYKAVKGKGDVSHQLYLSFGDQTANVMARGCRYLAAVWDGAWKSGTNKLKSKSLKKVSTVALRKLYKDPKELASYHLDTIKQFLK